MKNNYLTNELEFIFDEFNKMNLKGNIKSITEISYEDGDIFSKPYERKTFISFNTKGEIIELMHLVSDDIQDKYSLTYDSKGNLIEKVEYFSYSNKTSKVIYDYNNNGFPTRKVDYDSDNNIISTIFYLCDENGNIMEEKHLDILNDTISKIVYKYDANFNIVEKFDPKSTSKNEFTYDEHSLLIEEKYLVNNEVKGLRTMEFDSYGDYTKKSFEFYSDGEKYMCAFGGYNRKGQLLRDFAGNDYNYNDRGDVESVETFVNGHYRTDYNYEYDDYNWLKMNSFNYEIAPSYAENNEQYYINKSEYLVATRKIEYH